jgi:AcrR family transcriptional regulator
MSKNKNGLSREEWLTKALDSLTEASTRALTIESLVRRLGVSRGSFYWHFNDMNDFTHQLVEHWSNIYTELVITYTDQLETSPEEQLFLLMEQITNQRLAKYDIFIRAWAAQDPTKAAMVRKIDKLRLDYVRSIFKAMGFKGEELEMRTRTFVVYFSLEAGLFVRQSRKEQMKMLKLQHALFIRN